MFSLIYVWIKDWVNNREAGDLRRYRAHHDVIVMVIMNCMSIGFINYLCVGLCLNEGQYEGILNDCYSQFPSTTIIVQAPHLWIRLLAAKSFENDVLEFWARTSYHEFEDLIDWHNLIKPMPFRMCMIMCEPCIKTYSLYFSAYGWLRINMKPINIIKRALCVLFTTSMLMGIYISSSRSHPDPEEMNGSKESIETNRLQREDGTSSGGLKIVVYAKMRTGSTFVSESLNNHGNIFTTFEPLGNMDIEEILDDGLQVIRNALYCNFTPLWHNISQLRKEWLNNNVFCSFQNKTAGCQGKEKSDSLDIRVAEAFCKRHHHVATKVIRVRRIEVLDPLMAGGVKVIHLIRDPLGLLSSRTPFLSNLHSTLDAYEMTESYCNGVVIDILHMRRRYHFQPRQVDRTYFLLRYEDLASRPNQTVEEIYNFLGIKPDTSLRHWLSSLSSLAPQTREMPYGTKRKNSAQTSSSWRQKLSFKEVKLVQRACRTMMEVMGYRILSSQQELLDTALDTLLPYNKDAHLHLWNALWNSFDFQNFLFNTKDGISKVEKRYSACRYHKYLCL